jgi:hypothetical protein
VNWSLYVDDSADLTDRELMARAKLGDQALRREADRRGLPPAPEVPGAGTSGARWRSREHASQAGEARERGRRGALAASKRPENINDRPSMIDLKESGDIEAHAHTVLLLYQPQDNKGEFTREDEIIIGKQRNGPLGSEPVTFRKETLTFGVRA